MRFRRAYTAAALAALAKLVACTLNPQPLPPIDNGAESGEGGAFGSHDAGSKAEGSDSSDAGLTPSYDADAGDGGDADADAGDAGDGGDADAG